MALEIVMPRLSDSMEEGTILQWFVAEGDPVQQGQPLVEVETDKANITYDADTSGVILALRAQEGDSVRVGMPIAIIGEAGEELPASVGAAAVGAVAPASMPPEHAPEPGAAATQASSPRPGRRKASPLARRIAAQLDVDLAALTGSGPHGRVIRADVERAVATTNGETAEPHAIQPEPASETAPAAKGETTLQELTRMQRTVARRMAESRATVPDIELRSEVDMSEAVALRERLREVTDAPPSLNDLIVKATSLALREFPRVNGAYRDGSFELYSRVNVGIAVAADDALVVPTIFDADTKSLGEISKVSRTLAARVRDGSIAPAELAGGTFTVSNLGMYGVESFSAVINQPQAAILAVGAIRRRPLVDENDAVVVRPTIVLTLACDHRILYGADGARFLARVRELLERPHSLLL